MRTDPARPGPTLDQIKDRTIDSNKNKLVSRAGRGLTSPKKCATVGQMPVRRDNIRTYRAWKQMLHRCRHGAPRTTRYDGMDYDPRWTKFAAFLADMGEAPPGLSLDRIDNEKGYWPWNCRWATRFEQMNNRHDNLWPVIAGERKRPTEWAKIAGINVKLIHSRINAGWSHLDAIFTPKGYTRMTYPPPSHALMIWLGPDGNWMVAIPPLPGSDKGHTLMVPASPQGMRVIDTIMKERRVAFGRPTAKIGHKASPTQYDLREIEKALKGRPITKLPPRTAKRVDRLLKEALDINLEELGL